MLEVPYRFSADLANWEAASLPAPAIHRRLGRPVEKRERVPSMRDQEFVSVKGGLRYRRHKSV